MLKENGASLRLLLMVVAVVMFAIAGFGWPAPVEPYRLKIVALGLFFWSVSTFV